MAMKNTPKHQTKGNPMICADCGQGGGTLVKTSRGYVHAVRGNVPKQEPRVAPVGAFAKAVGFWTPDQNRGGGI